MDGLGELIKSERLGKKTAIEDISNRTNIPEKVIRALENNDFSKIPGKFYLKNFIKNYLLAIDVNHEEFMLKYKDLINNIPFKMDKKNDYLYRMKYSRFEKKGIFIKLLMTFIVLIIGYFLIYENLEDIKSFLTPEKINKITELPQSKIQFENIGNQIYYGFDILNNSGNNTLDEQLNLSTDKWAIDLVIIVNKKNWITIFQGGEKLVGKDFLQGEVIKLKGYRFYLHTQSASAIDVLLNGKELNYFKGKSGYQKLLITPENLESK